MQTGLQVENKSQGDAVTARVASHAKECGECGDTECRLECPTV